VVVLVALVAVLMAMMAMVVLVAVIVMVVMVIMAATAGIAMGMLMRVVVLVRMIMAVAGVRMAVAVLMAVVMVGVIAMIMATAAGVAMLVVMDLGLGLERPLDLAHRAALAANQLGQRRILLDIDCIGGDLDRDMAAAEMPGETREPQRVLGGDRDQLLRRRPDQHERAVLELDGIPVIQRSRLVEIEQDVAPAIPLERGMASVAAMMVEGEGLDDPVLLDRGLADDGDGALHDETRGVMDQGRSLDRRSHHFDHRSGRKASPALRRGRAIGAAGRAMSGDQRGSALTSSSNFLRRRDRSAGLPQRGVS